MPTRIDLDYDRINRTYRHLSGDRGLVSHLDAVDFLKDHFREWLDERGIKAWCYATEAGWTLVVLFDSGKDAMLFKLTYF